MTTTPIRTVRPPTVLQPTKKPVRWPIVLAIIGAPIACLEAWTLGAWLLDGPYQIDKYRDTSSFQWYLAWCYTAIALIVSVFIVVYLVRQCRRERKILTFDVMFVMCGGTLFWLDIGCNWFYPVFLFNSNWINLNTPLGNVPGVVNPHAGLYPDALLFTIPLESTCLLAIAMAMGKLVSWMRNRWPEMSMGRLLTLLFVVCMSIELLLEIPIIAAGLWTYTGGPSLPVGDFKWAVLELLGGAAVFSLTLLRVFRDDQGRSFVERNLDRVHPRRRPLVSLLAMYAVFQLVGDGLGNLVILSGPYSPKWQEMPNAVVNDTCDAPGVTGTAYGPCPGDEDYRMPGRQTKLPPGKTPE